MSSIPKSAYLYATEAVDPTSSYLQLFNPLSQIFSGRPDRLPDWARYIPLKDDDSKYLAVKGGAALLLGAALAGGTRMVRHLKTLANIRGADTLDPHLSSELNYSYELTTPPEGKTTKQASADDASLLGSAIGAAVPVGALILGAAGAYKAVDYWANKHQKKVLEKRIQAKGDYVKNLAVVRAQLAKGAITPEQALQALQRPDFEDEELLAKKASGAASGEKDGIINGLGLLTAALLTTSFIAGKLYAENTDEKNIKHKAYKKGLAEYAAQRSKAVPLNVNTATREIFERIDQNARAIPGENAEAGPFNNNPIPLSITL